jgi:hypothetical protein
MRILYRVNRYPHVFKSAIARHRTGYSIDEVDEDGRYICQIAYWFRTEDEAKKRLAEIIEEDGAQRYPRMKSAEWTENRSKGGA